LDVKQELRKERRCKEAIEKLALLHEKNRLAKKAKDVKANLALPVAKFGGNIA
jgi:hypothetical protein